MPKIIDFTTADYDAIILHKLLDCSDAEIAEIIGADKNISISRQFIAKVRQTEPYQARLYRVHWLLECLLSFINE